MLVALLFVGAWQTSLAQKVSVEISGTVVSELQDPIIGAFITLPESKLGTVSEFDGSYRMEVSIPVGDNRLEVSYLGYQTYTATITVSEAQRAYTMDVVMQEDRLNLDEVVVVGSTVQARRKQLGNALTTLNADNLTDANPQSVTSALQGKNRRRANRPKLR